MTMGTFTVCETPDDVLPRKLESPAYTALSVRVPEVLKVIRQLPELTGVTGQASPVLAVTVTFPVGVPLN